MRRCVISEVSLLGLINIRCMLRVFMMMCRQSGSLAVLSVHTMLLRMRMPLAMVHWRMPLSGSTFLQKRNIHRIGFPIRSCKKEDYWRLMEKWMWPGGILLSFMLATMMLLHGFHNVPPQFGMILIVESYRWCGVSVLYWPNVYHILCIISVRRQLRMIILLLPITVRDI